MMAAHFDLIIENGRVVDGTGNPWYRAQVGITGDRITAIGDLRDAAAERRIDAHDHIVAPGFIDPLHNGEVGVLSSPDPHFAVHQGVTTVIVGNCGVSAAPIAPAQREAFRHHSFFKTGSHNVPWTWSTLAEYFDHVSGATSVNVASMIGFDNLWVSVKGYTPGPAIPQELDQMKTMAAQAMDDGAVGLSHGAGAASLWSTHAEVVEVAQVIGTKGGVYCAHGRGIEGDDLLSPYRESIAVGVEANVPVHFLHFRTGDLRQLGKAREMMSVVDEARVAGQDVTVASYPYTPGGGGLRVPAWAEEGGPEAILARLRDPEIRTKIVADWDRLWNWESRIASTTTAKNRWCEGKTLKEIGAVTGKSVGEVICWLIEEENLGVEATHYLGDEDDVRLIMTHPAHMACSDAQYSGDFLHPRAYGSYPRYLGHYVRELGILRLEDCVRRMTAFPAQRMGLDDRGLIKVGMAADVVVFDADTIIDRATYESPRHYPPGIDAVLVNGTVVVEAGAYSGLTPGRPVRRRRLELTR